MLARCLCCLCLEVCGLFLDACVSVYWSIAKLEDGGRKNADSETHVMKPLVRRETPNLNAADN